MSTALTVIAVTIVLLALVAFIVIASAIEREAQKIIDTAEEIARAIRGRGFLR